MKETKASTNPRGRPTLDAAKLIAGRILSAAENSFVNCGYEATTMDGVARDAHVSKRTLYEKFPNKAALFSETATQVASLVNLKLATIEIQDGDLTEQLKDLATKAVSIILESNFVAIQHIILAERLQFPDLAREISESTQSILTNAVCEIIRDNRRDSEPAQIEIDSEIFVESVIATLVRTRLQQSKNAARHDHDARRIEIFVKGIASD